MGWPVSIRNRHVSSAAVAGGAGEHTRESLVDTCSLCGIAIGAPGDQLWRLPRLDPSVNCDDFYCICSRMATIASPLRPRIRFAAAASGIDVGVTRGFVSSIALSRAY